MGRDKELLRLIIGGAVGLGIGSLLGVAAASLTEDAGLASVTGGFLGLAIGVLIALFRIGD